MSFTTASTIDDALAAMAQGARPVAGGSDLVVGARQGTRPLPERLVAIDRIEDLNQIEIGRDECRIGAGVTHARLMSDTDIVATWTALADAAALVGSPATRNVGTLGGNVMNGSPAMDTGAPLLVLGAQVELRSVGGRHLTPVDALWSGPGETTAAVDELCTAIVLPRPEQGTGSAYVRLEYRRAMEIAVVGAAARVQLDANARVVSATVALTAVAPTILAVHDLEVQGRSVDAALLSHVADCATSQARPISDLRAGDEYRRHMVGVMARRAFHGAAQRASGTRIDVPVNRALGIGART